MLIRQIVKAGVLVAAAGATLLFAAACGDDDNGNDGGNGANTPAAGATPGGGEGTAAPTLPAGPTRDPDVTPGTAATIELSADPQEMECDGQNTSVVTATVLDAQGQPVEDDTRVMFRVDALGTALPISTSTTNGIAQSNIVALGEGVGVVVNVTSGEAAVAIRIDCL